MCIYIYIYIYIYIVQWACNTAINQAFGMVEISSTVILRDSLYIMFYPDHAYMYDVVIYYIYMIIWRWSNQNGTSPINGWFVAENPNIKWVDDWWGPRRDK